MAAFGGLMLAAGVAAPDSTRKSLEQTLRQAAGHLASLSSVASLSSPAALLPQSPTPASSPATPSAASAPSVAASVPSGAGKAAPDASPNTSANTSPSATSAGAKPAAPAARPVPAATLLLPDVLPAKASYGLQAGQFVDAGQATALGNRVKALKLPYDQPLAVVDDSGATWSVVAIGPYASPELAIAARPNVARALGIDGGLPLLLLPPPPAAPAAPSATPAAAAAAPPTITGG